MPTSTVEDYLKAILIEEQGGGELVGMGQIGTALGVAPGTVTAMVKTLADSGLVSYEPYAGVRLTAAGRRLATHVVRRHRLIELFLVNILGFDWSQVHEDAERLEHAVSELMIERIDEMLGHPEFDPHGDPIPSAQGDLPESEWQSLVSCSVGEPLRMVRVGNQDAAFLRLLERNGLTLGSELLVAERDELADQIVLRLGSDARVTLGLRAAAEIFVTPVGG